MEIKYEILEENRSVTTVGSFQGYVVSLARVRATD